MVVVPAVPRIPMVATGVSSFISPVRATWPATKLNVPLTRLTTAEFDVLLAS
jgi:hypothetical protein